MTHIYLALLAENLVNRTLQENRICVKSNLFLSSEDMMFIYLYFAENNINVFVYNLLVHTDAVTASVTKSIENAERPSEGLENHRSKQLLTPQNKFREKISCGLKLFLSAIFTVSIILSKLSQSCKPSHTHTHTRLLSK